MIEIVVNQSQDARYLAELVAAEKNSRGQNGKTEYVSYYISNRTGGGSLHIAYTEFIVNPPKEDQDDCGMR